jgi:hypothetical protein
VVSLKINSHVIEERVQPLLRVGTTGFAEPLGPHTSILAFGHDPEETGAAARLVDSDDHTDVIAGPGSFEFQQIAGQ